MSSPSAPPLAETKAAILAEHDEAWYEKKIKEMNDHYGGAFEDEATLAWLVAVENNVEVADITAKDGGEGTETSFYAISEMFDVDFDEIANGATRVKPGPKFVAPKKEKHWAFPAVIVLSVEESETSSGKDKLIMMVSDGTEKAHKLTVNGDACQMFYNIKIKPGMIIRLPLVSIQYGYYTDKDGDEIIWWNLQVPPFGSVSKLAMDVSELIPSIDQVAPDNKSAVFLDGMIINVDSNTNDVCAKCGSWFVEGKEEEHDKCADKGGDVEIEERTTYEATSLSTKGQSRTLYFDHTYGEPQSELRELRRFVGLVMKNGKIKVLSELDVDPETAKKTGRGKPKVQAKETPKKVAKPKPELEEADDEEKPAPKRTRRTRSAAEESDDEPEPTPKRRTRRAQSKKLETEEVEDPDEEEEAPKVTRRRMATKAPEPEPEEPDEEEEADEEPEEPVRRRVRRSVAKKAPEPEPEPDEEEEDEPVEVELTDEFAYGLVDILAQMTGGQEWPAVGRAVVHKKLIPGFVKPDDRREVSAAIKKAFKPYLDAAVAEGIVAYVKGSKTRIVLGEEGKAMLEISEEEE